MFFPRRPFFSRRRAHRPSSPMDSERYRLQDRLERIIIIIKMGQATDKPASKPAAGHRRKVWLEGLLLIFKVAAAGIGLW